MELRQLEYFLAAAQTQNFRRAAEISLVAQSALSRQIAALEEELGVELFRRANRRVTLTPAGEEFAVYAREALGRLQQGRQAMVEVEAGERGTVLLGCVEALATAFLPPLFARFHQRHPGIRLQIQTGGTDVLLPKVESGELELGLVFPIISSEALEVRELFHQPIQLVAPPGHPLARRGAPVRLDEIRHEPLVMLGHQFGIHRVMRTEFARRGFALQPLVEIDSIEAVKEFVKQGVGLTFMPAALLRQEQIGRELRLLEIEDLREEFKFALVYRPFAPLSRAARALIVALEAG